MSDFSHLSDVQGNLRLLIRLESTCPDTLTLLAGSLRVLGTAAVVVSLFRLGDWRAAPHPAPTAAPSVVARLPATPASERLPERPTEPVPAHAPRPAAVVTPEAQAVRELVAEFEALGLGTRLPFTGLMPEDVQPDAVLAVADRWAADCLPQEVAWGVACDEYPCVVVMFTADFDANCVPPGATLQRVEVARYGESWGSQHGTLLPPVIAMSFRFEGDDLRFGELVEAREQRARFEAIRFLLDDSGVIEQARRGVRVNKVEAFSVVAGE